MRIDIKNLMQGTDFMQMTASGKNSGDTQQENGMFSDILKQLEQNVQTVPVPGDTTVSVSDNKDQSQTDNQEQIMPCTTTNTQNESPCADPVKLSVMDLCHINRKISEKRSLSIDDNDQNSIISGLSGEMYYYINELSDSVSEKQNDTDYQTVSFSSVSEDNLFRSVSRSFSDDMSIYGNLRQRDTSEKISDGSDDKQKSFSTETTADVKTRAVREEEVPDQTKTVLPEDTSYLAADNKPVTQKSETDYTNPEVSQIVLPKSKTRSYVSEINSTVSFASATDKADNSVNDQIPATISAKTSSVRSDDSANKSVNDQIPAAISAQATSVRSDDSAAKSVNDHIPAAISAQATSVRSDNSANRSVNDQIPAAISAQATSVRSDDSANKSVNDQIPATISAQATSVRSDNSAAKSVNDQIPATISAQATSVKSDVSTTKSVKTSISGVKQSSSRSNQVNSEDSEFIQTEMLKAGINQILTEVHHSDINVSNTATTDNKISMSGVIEKTPVAMSDITSQLYSNNSVNNQNVSTNYQAQKVNENLPEVNSETAKPIETQAQQVQSQAVNPVEAETSQVQSQAVNPVEAETSQVQSQAVNPVEAETPQVQSQTVNTVEAETSQVQSQAVNPLEAETPQVQSQTVNTVEAETSQVQSQAVNLVEAETSQVQSQTVNLVESETPQVQSQTVNLVEAETSQVQSQAVNPEEAETSQVQSQAVSPLEAETSQVQSQAVNPVEAETSQVQSQTVNPLEAETSQVQSQTVNPLEAETPQVQSQIAKPVETETPQVQSQTVNPVETETPQVQSQAVNPVEAETPQVQSQTVKPVETETPQVQSQTVKPVETETPQVQSQTVKPVETETPQVQSQTVNTVEAEAPQVTSQTVKPVESETTETKVPDLQKDSVIQVKSEDSELINTHTVTVASDIADNENTRVNDINTYVSEPVFSKNAEVSDTVAGVKFSEEINSSVIQTEPEILIESADDIQTDNAISAKNKITDISDKIIIDKNSNISESESIIDKIDYSDTQNKNNYSVSSDSNHIIDEKNSEFLSNNKVNDKKYDDYVENEHAQTDNIDRDKSAESIDKTEYSEVEEIIHNTVILDRFSFVGRSELLMDQNLTEKEISDQTINALEENIINKKDEFVIKLTPEGLGDITVKLIRSDNEIVVKMIASNEKTSQLLNRELGILQNVLGRHNAHIQTVEYHATPQSYDNNRTGNSSMHYNYNSDTGSETDNTDGRRNRQNYHNYNSLTQNEDEEEVVQTMPVIIGNTILNRYI